MNEKDQQNVNSQLYCPIAVYFKVGNNHNPLKFAHGKLREGWKGNSTESQVTHSPSLMRVCGQVAEGNCGSWTSLSTALVLTGLSLTSLQLDYVTLLLPPPPPLSFMFLTLCLDVYF